MLKKDETNKGEKKGGKEGKAISFELWRKNGDICLPFLPWRGKRT